MCCGKLCKCVQEILHMHIAKENSIYYSYVISMYLGRNSHRCRDLHKYSIQSHEYQSRTSFLKMNTAMHDGSVFYGRVSQDT